MPSLPPTTKALILVCVAVFFVDQLLVRGLLDSWFALWSPASGQFMPWQLLTYALLHGSFAHLFFNMIGLWLFGGDLERLWGRNRYLQFIAVSVVVAGLTQMLVTVVLGTPGYTIGASGALFGLLLGFALAFPRRQFDLVGFLPMLLLMVPNSIINLIGFGLYMLLLTNRAAVPIPPMPVPAMTMVALFGGIELLFGVFFRSGGIAHFAHLGGMLGGWLMILYWRGRGPFKRRR